MQKIYIVLMNIHLLGPSILEQFCPFNWIVKFSSEVRGKISISKIWSVIFFHKIHIRWWFTLPIVPKPFTSKTGHSKDTPVNKDTEFGFVIPRRQWPLVQWIPIRLISDAWTKRNNCTEPKCKVQHLSFPVQLIGFCFGRKRVTWWTQFVATSIQGLWWNYGPAFHYKFRYSRIVIIAIKTSSILELQG